MPEHNPERRLRILLGPVCCTDSSGRGRRIDIGNQYRAVLETSGWGPPEWSDTPEAAVERTQRAIKEAVAAARREFAGEVA